MLTPKHMLGVGQYLPSGVPDPGQEKIKQLAKPNALDWVAWIVADYDDAPKREIIWAQVVGDDVFNEAFKVNALNAGSIYLREVGRQKITPGNWTKTA